jgi:enamine deaminase RidA (YjgF/YER057c/UK114 family)
LDRQKLWHKWDQQGPEIRQANEAVEQTKGFRPMTDRTVTHLEGTDFQKSRAFSPAIVTQGGKIVWLAGQTALADLDGKSIAQDFEAQARTCFALIDHTLNRVGGKLADLVTMTVSINDPRYGDRFIKIRHEMFPNGKFPCSALITVSNFAHPGILIEIQGVAVV